MSDLIDRQPERLTDDDFETIRIHLNAYKGNLCNQQRWKEAEEYQRIIDRFMAFASAQPESEQMYKKAFSVACELLIGANLFGTTEETMFKEIMDKEGIVSSLGYEKYILENLARLTGEDDDTD